MNTSGVIKWAKSAALASLGGGIAAAVAASMDPNKWKFPADLGSGKLLPFFFTGAALAFGGMLLHSPLGQSAMQAYKDAQQQLEQSKADMEAAKAALRHPTSPKETTTMNDKPTPPAPPPATPPEPPHPPQKS